ncbi:MAG: 50S ribosomal protein L18 [Planctomycetota bacterium]|nr:50S ribosomal protein L18 [Planctomycetota bacterium]
MKATFVKQSRRARRTLSVRSHIRRTSELPRLSVSRSSKHISAQVIDDIKGVTIAHATSTAKALGTTLKGKTKTERAKIIGAEIAKKAKEKGIEAVVFDRGFTRYHGRVKALADAAREGGLKF